MGLSAITFRSMANGSAWIDGVAFSSAATRDGAVWVPQTGREKPPAPERHRIRCEAIPSIPQLRQVHRPSAGHPPASGHGADHHLPHHHHFVFQAASIWKPGHADGIKPGHAGSRCQQQAGLSAGRHVASFRPRMFREAAACSSAMSTQCCEARAMAPATSGRMMPPESLVAGPLALTMVRTPKVSKIFEFSDMMGGLHWLPGRTDYGIAGPWSRQCCAGFLSVLRRFRQKNRRQSCFDT